MNKNLSAREVALEVLTKVDKNKSYSNIQLNKTISKANLEQKDINFATELIYGTIQRLNTIDWIIRQFIKKNTKLEGWVHNLLRLSIYQIWYLDKVPNHAVVNEAVNIAKNKGHKGISGLVNGILRNVIRNKDSLKLPDKISDVEKISIEHSHPKWIVERFIKDFGLEETTEICRVNNLAPIHSIRVNILKTSRERIINQLRTEFKNADIEPSLLSEQGIRVKGAGNLALSSWYKDGLISIQDESSMLVANVLDSKPNMYVLDALAAPGGKTTHISEKMANKGTIIASDIHKHKIKLIEEQQKRLGLNIIETKEEDARNIQKHYGQVFDRILLDVPCSGLGVIRRKPDLKWTKQEDDISKLVTIQSEILNNVSKLLKPDGVLVYSTCTMAKDENQYLIEEFLANNPDFELDSNLVKYLPNYVNQKIDTSKGMIQILPHHFNSDGFFIARIIRKS